MGRTKFFRNINGINTELTAFTEEQVSNLFSQCQELLKQKNPEEYGYMIQELDLEVFPGSNVPHKIKKLGEWIDALEDTAIDYHVHVSPETLIWSSYEETRFTTVDKDRLPVFDFVHPTKQIKKPVLAK